MCETTSVTWRFLQPLLKRFSRYPIYVPNLDLYTFSTAVVLWFSNSPPRYLSEFLFGGQVAGRVIYYLFEILYFSTRYGRVRCWASYRLSFENPPDELVGELSNIFSNSWGEFGIGRVAGPQ